ncbi:MAG: oxalurate catabolism protein HpxZ [Caulobacteraceae bacterium]
MSETLVLNDPAVLAEVTAAFDTYEAALMANDIHTLDWLFWPSPNTVRYGVGENLYGEDEILAFRKTRLGGSPQRMLTRVVITTFGQDFATANAEFQRQGDGRVGRQSHAWVRLPEGWRIVAAHVSFKGGTS